MVNKDFELDRLRDSLKKRGIDSAVAELIVEKANKEIETAMARKIAEAMEVAISSGVEKDSADFINDLRPAPDAFQLETASNNTDFSTPPYPMLPWLLKNAKPMKDGSGVYKVIPVGKPSNKPSIATNIFDAQKAIAAERVEAAKRQYNKMAPEGSKTQFRTATSKQSQATQWVMPAKEKDFTEELKDINRGLEQDLQDIVLEVIRDFEESF